MASLMRGHVLAFGIGLLGCGDSLVDEEFKGMPIASFQGTVYVENVTAKHPRVAAFWAPSLGESSLGTFVEQVSTSQAAVSGSPLTINLFDEPKPLLAWDPNDAQSPRYAAGRVLAYDDLDDNQRKSNDEPWIGGMLPFALLYAPEALPARKGPSRLDVPKGLHTTWLPWPCDNDPEPTGEGDCGTQLAGRCSNPGAKPNACAEGVCVDRFVFPWPGGACLVPIQEDGCVPERGVRLRGEGKELFTLACTETSQCMREQPYRCDPIQGACVPYDVPRVGVNGRPIPANFCKDPLLNMPPPVPNGQALTPARDLPSASSLRAF